LKGGEVVGAARGRQLRIGADPGGGVEGSRPGPEDPGQVQPRNPLTSQKEAEANVEFGVSQSEGPLFQDEGQTPTGSRRAGQTGGGVGGLENGGGIGLEPGIGGGETGGGLVGTGEESPRPGDDVVWPVELTTDTGLDSLEEMLRIVDKNGFADCRSEPGMDAELRGVRVERLRVVGNVEVNVA
jgi:hypothetical protein